MSKKELRDLFLIFIIWKLLILVFSNASQLFFPLQTSFLGGGLLNYLRNANFWGFINFDGEHYLSIARDGYLPLTYFYFPLYPILVKIIAFTLSEGFFAYGISGLFLSNVFLFIAVIGIYRTVKELILDDARMTIILLLAFPTSFFLGAFYNESLFLALAVWGFYFAFKKKWLFAIILAGLASATRVVGVALAAGIMVEYLMGERKLTQIRCVEIFHKVAPCEIVKSIGVGILSLSGLLFYMGYLHIKTGSALEFFNNITIFGEQRSTVLVSLPQVFYRYFFKILPSLNYDYFPVVFTTYLEITTAILFCIAIAIMIFKMRASYVVYCLLAFLIPVLSGSFSSLPRYVLVIFPVFILFGNYINTKSRAFRYVILPLLLLSNLIAVSLYIRGYFVA